MPLKRQNRAMQSFRWRAWLAWASLSLLALLCGLLAVLQYRWIGEISDAERTRLREALQLRLAALSHAFNEEITAACSALEPPSAEIAQAGIERAYAVQYQLWKQSHEPLFQRIGLAIPGGEEVRLLLLDQNTGQFAPADWPDAWAAVHERLARRGAGGPAAPSSRNPALLELPRFGPAGQPPAPPERDWLLLELNLDYMRRTVLPRYLQRYLGERGTLEYDAEVVPANGASDPIFRSEPHPPQAVSSRPDAWVELLETRGPGFGGRGRGAARGSGPDREPPVRKLERRVFRLAESGPFPPDGGQGRWRLYVRHRAGSLDVLVAATRRRNLAVSAGILGLILATVAALVRLSRRAHRLAELQMNFVAGVSHELRTPLTVIRTAAFNLRGRLAARPEQVEKYGALIQSESEKLTLLVEQVLRFAGSQAGHVIRSREPVALEKLVDDGLRTIDSAGGKPSLVIEKRLEPALPMLLADELSLRHVLQNLVDNALKHGADGNDWIGIFASAVEDETGTYVEIRVADHGPGIPVDEQRHIFDPFFRGRRALEDQIHGTGLGLNLVKRIVEAHGGTIRVESAPARGTEFIIRIPAAPPELQDEIANTAG